MKKALIKNGIVKNVIEVSGDFVPEQGFQIVSISENDFLDIGYLYEGESFIKPVPQISVLKYKKIKEAEYLYNQKIMDGLVFENNTYQIRDSDRQNMNDVYTKLTDGQSNPHGGAWRNMDNQMVPMNDAKVKQFIDAVFLYRLQLLQALWTHKDNINGITRSEDVIDYDVTTRYPQN